MLLRCESIRPVVTWTTSFICILMWLKRCFVEITCFLFTCVIFLCVFSLMCVYVPHFGTCWENLVLSNLLPLQSDRHTNHTTTHTHTQSMHKHQCTQLLETSQKTWPRVILGLLLIACASCPSKTMDIFPALL